MWGPGEIREVRDLVERIRIHSRKPEQLMPTSLPVRPWQGVTADFVQWEGSHYLVMAGYFPRYIKVANLPKLITAITVERLKVIFARFGISETLVTDKGPQFTSCDFDQESSFGMQVDCIGSWDLTCRTPDGEENKFKSPSST